MPDISGIQVGPPTKAQIMAQMKKDGLSLDLFKQVPFPFKMRLRACALEIVG